MLLLDDHSTCHPSATPVPSGTDDAAQTMQLPKLSYHNMLDTANLIFIKGVFPIALLWPYLICLAELMKTMETSVNIGGPRAEV